MIDGGSTRLSFCKPWRAKWRRRHLLDGSLTRLTIDGTRPDAPRRAEGGSIIGRDGKRRSSSINFSPSTAPRQPLSPCGEHFLAYTKRTGRLSRTKPRDRTPGNQLHLLLRRPPRICHSLGSLVSSQHQTALPVAGSRQVRPSEMTNFEIVVS
jgi:hypothetical protein